MNDIIALYDYRHEQIVTSQKKENKVKLSLSDPKRTGP